MQNIARKTVQSETFAIKDEELRKICGIPDGWHLAHAVVNVQRNLDRAVEIRFERDIM